MAKVSIDLSKVDRAATAAFKDTCLLMDTAFTQSISDPKWDWIRQPSPRDIVDTGRLRAAQQLQFLSDSEAQFSWDTEYALFVLLGYTLRNGRNVPGRDWVKDGIARANPQLTFMRLLAARLK